MKKTTTDAVDAVHDNLGLVKEDLGELVATLRDVANGAASTASEKHSQQAYEMSVKADALLDDAMTAADKAAKKAAKEAAKEVRNTAEKAAEKTKTAVLETAHSASESAQHHRKSILFGLVALAIGVVVAGVLVRGNRSQ
jgi:hypothetical protein